MRVLNAHIVALLAVVIAAVTPLRAQEEGQPGAGFLTPFPPQDIYQTVAIGDGLAEGLLSGIVEAMGSEARVNITRKHRQVSGIIRPDFDDALKGLEDQLGKETPQIALVMIGLFDRVPLRNATGDRRLVPVGSDIWRAEYARRVDRLMKALRKRSISVYWVGLPSLRRPEASEEAQMINEIVREKAFLNGVRFIDSMAGFADEQGSYSDMGPDITGKIRRLREVDGSFTDAGNRKLAHFVERELRRDLAQAKQDRSIPLAGSESEQAAIAPKPAAAAGPPAGQPSGQITKPAETATPTQGNPIAQGDLKADPGRINLRTIGAGGREDIVTLDIIRPPLPESVIRIVTRKESGDKPSQVGETLLDQISGGVTVMSSVTPASDLGGSSRRKLSPTQTPYFRLLVKGERLTPRPGRADELIWPRPQPQAIPDAPPAPAVDPAPATQAPSGGPAPKSVRRTRDRG